MKLRPFRHGTPAAPRTEAKSAPVTPAPRRPPAEPPPRVWSLLLPPGFSNDRRP